MNKALQGILSTYGVEETICSLVDMVETAAIGTNPNFFKGISQHTGDSAVEFLAYLMENFPFDDEDGKLYTFADSGLADEWIYTESRERYEDCAKDIVITVASNTKAPADGANDGKGDIPTGYTVVRVTKEDLQESHFRNKTDSLFNEIMYLRILPGIAEAFCCLGKELHGVGDNVGEKLLRRKADQLKQIVSLYADCQIQALGYGCKKSEDE